MNVNEQWETYKGYSLSFRCTIFCSHCGSGYVDGRGGRIICFACNNAAHWSPDRFRFARDMRTLDANQHQAFLEATGREWRQGIETSNRIIENEIKDDFSWHGDIVRATETFLAAAATSKIETSTEHGRQFDKEQIQKLLAACRELTEKIEVTLASLT